MTKHYFVIIGIDSAGQDVPLLHKVLLPKLLSADLQNTFSAIMVFHTALYFNTEPTSQQMKYGSGAMIMEFAGVHHVSYHPKASEQTEQKNAHWKTQLQHQVSGNTLQGLSKVLQESVYALIGT